MSMTLQFLEPEYYKDFSCLGGDCRFNCCNELWNIYVDKKTYKKYKNTKNKDIKDKLATFLTKVKNPNTPSMYGRIQQVVSKDGKVSCAFQTEDGLCDIHAKLGPEYLCHTCLVYPRRTNLFGLILEKGLSSSCEEVLNLLYHHKDPLKFTSYTLEGSQNKMEKELSGVSQNLSTLTTRPIREHYLTIKTTCLAILQNRSYLLETRITHLLIYLSKLDQLEKTEKSNEVEKYSDQFLSLLQEGQIPCFDDIPPLYDQQFHLAIAMCGQYNSNNSYLSNTIKTYLDDSIDPDEKIERLQFSTKEVDQYKESLQAFQTHLEEYSHLWENIFVNELHYNMMPFFSNYDIWESGLYFASLFTMYRFVVGTELLQNPELSHIELIDILSSLGKKIIHSPTKHKKILKFLELNESKNLQKATLLVKSVQKK